MIKFKHRKHVSESKESGKIVIYYNVSDIFLGTALMVLVIFFIYNYLSHSLPSRNYPYAKGAYMEQSQMNFPSFKP